MYVAKLSLCNRSSLNMDNIQKSNNKGPDYLLGEVMQPSDSRLSETTAFVPRLSKNNRTR